MRRKIVNARFILFFVERGFDLPFFAPFLQLYSLKDDKEHRQHSSLTPFQLLLPKGQE